VLKLCKDILGVGFRIFRSRLIFKGAQEGYAIFDFEFIDNEFLNPKSKIRNLQPFTYRLVNHVLYPAAYLHA
jgi:hypothetical protein